MPLRQVNAFLRGEKLVDIDYDQKTYKGGGGYLGPTLDEILDADGLPSFDVERWHSSEVRSRQEEAAYFFPPPGELPENELYPWLLSNSESQGVAYLCDFCRNIDFSYISTHQTRYDIYLGQVKDVSSRQCLFCRLLMNGKTAETATFGTGRMFDEDHVFLKSSPYSRSSLYGWDDTTRQDGLVLEASFSRAHGVAIMGHTLSQFHAVGPGDRGPFKPLQPQYDSCTARAWLGRCLRSSTEQESVHGFVERFIDTAKLQVVLAKERFPQGGTDMYKFAALSYVWGPQGQQTTLTRESLAKFSMPGGLSPSNAALSRTVRHAISVCQDLDIRYLWVDGLCIIQDAPQSEKMKQIRHLHRVYENAALTIIAASGDSADSGLPGVSYDGESPLQPRQPSVTVNDGVVLCPHPQPLQGILESAIWRTRAWTFQEFLLSPRRLVFTKHGTYFSCKHGVCCEGLHHDVHPLEEDISEASETPRADSRDNTRDSDDLSKIGMLYRPAGRLNWKTYAEMASSYTTKALTDSRDRLPAFTALSQVFSRDIFSGWHLSSGLPLAAIDAALLWRGCLGCTECKNTPHGLKRPTTGDQQLVPPSWSWAGWEGHVRYSDYVLMNENPSRSIIRLAKYTMAFVTTSPWQPVPDAPAIYEVPEDGCLGTNAESTPDRAVTVPLLPHLGGTSPEHGAPSTNPDFWPLFVETDVATFFVSKRLYSSKSKNQEFHSMVNFDTTLHVLISLGDPLKVWDVASRSHCGVVFDDSDSLDSGMMNRVSFIKLSATYLSEKEDSYLPGPQETALTPSFMRLALEEAAEQPQGIRQYFDRNKYSLRQRWCMYNVLMVQWSGSYATRLGVGKIHADAFDEAKDIEKRRFFLA